MRFLTRATLTATIPTTQYMYVYVMYVRDYEANFVVYIFFLLDKIVQIPRSSIQASFRFHCFKIQIQIFYKTII